LTQEITISKIGKHVVRRWKNCAAINYLCMWVWVCVWVWMCVLCACCVRVCVCACVRVCVC